MMHNVWPSKFICMCICIQVQQEHSRRLAEFDMVERHIMQAQARAVSSDEREAHRLYSAVRDAHPSVYIPPGTNNFYHHDGSYVFQHHTKSWSIVLGIMMCQPKLTC